MRTHTTVLSLLFCVSMQAQLVNGSFENGSAGWNVPCACAPAYSTADVPGGTGNYSLALDNVNLSCLCMLFSPVDQFVPWMTPGPWQFSAWIKSAVPGDQPGSRISLSAGSPFSTPSLSDMWSYAGTWEYVVDTLAIDQSVVLDSLRISLIPDDGNLQPPSLCYFDHIQLTSLLSTGVPQRASLAPAFRPNPASDQLWIDLPESPHSLQLFDAQGHSVPVPQVVPSAHRLELSVSALPAGLYLLSMATARGSETVRFVKQ
jgi:hypothetical protein